MEKEQNLNEPQKSVLGISGIISSQEKILQNIKDIGFVENFDDKMCNAKIFHKQHENKYWTWKITYLEKDQHMIIFIIDSSNDEDIYFKGKIDNVKDFYDIIRLLEIKKITKNLSDEIPKESCVSDVRVSTYITCSAIWFKDGIKHDHQPFNIDTGFVICGHRHHNCFMTAYILNNNNKVKGLEEIQGFMTSENNFVDRKEGGQIAFKAGQTSELKTMLFSEDLY